MSLPPDLSAWDPWSPEEVAERLGTIGLPWAVVGGYAIDLWLGRTTREHSDIEIAILRPDFPRFRSCFPNHTLYTAGKGEIHLLPDGENTPAEIHQNWLLDEERMAWRLDIMLEPGDPDTWVFRRNESVQRPRSTMVGHRNGIPYLMPEGVLLYKARATRDKDERDLQNVLPTLSQAQKNWLRDMLHTVHPGHRWGEILR